MDLQHALAWREAARGRDLLDKRLDVGAQELERPVAGLADQMEMPWMPVRMLEPEAALAEIDFPGDSGVDHPLESPVDSRAADPLILALDQIDEIVGRQVAPSWRRNTLTIRSRLPERLLPAGRRLST
jgi:hypothetical protein